MSSKERRPDEKPDWEAQISEYDDECRKREQLFSSKHIVIGSDGSSKLDEMENEIISRFLAGESCDNIAEDAGVDSSEVWGMIEIIRLKLSLDD